jgi:phosphohistidine swiveling domain-containing protein
MGSGVRGMATDYILHPEDSDDFRRLGGKAGNLASLVHTDVVIPSWFVVTPEAFYASVSTEGKGSVPEINNLQPAEKVCVAVEQALARLCPQGETVAVRSSAIDEDNQQQSFAGQLDSFLFVTPEKVTQRVVDVWRSAFSERALAYRQQHGLPMPQAPAILVQKMLMPAAAGVAFSADPVSGRRGVAVVSAVHGTGDKLVSGQADGQDYRVDRTNTIIDQGVDACDAILDEPQVRRIVDLARKLEQHFGQPQDIEWAIADDTLYLLQSRPITSLASLSDPDGIAALWDNSNIAESYGGITLPLTFSFARTAYESVYREFARLMGAPEKTIQRQATVFRNMLGIIQGRVYYNLLNWYRALAMLPGFSFNRGFMEQMMGVKEGLPATVVAEIDQARFGARLGDGLHFLRSMIGVLSNFWLLKRKITRFYQRLETALGSDADALGQMRLDELVQHYRQLQQQLLTRWDAPLINDLFAMIFYGLLRKLSESWFDGAEVELHNTLLRNQGGIVSAEPARLVREMAEVAANDRELLSVLKKADHRFHLSMLTPWPEFQHQVQQYLQRFGDRCLEELKLESNTLHDDPSLLLQTMAHIAEHVGNNATDPGETPEPDPVLAAAQHVQKRLSRHPVKRLFFNWVLRHARALVQQRENLRFERTRVFGRVRRIFLEIGKRFTALELIESPRDIFYLEADEVLGIIEGTASTTRLHDLVALRKRNYQDYRQQPAPADRFETRGAVYPANDFQAQQAINGVHTGASLRGTGACPGRVCGRVRVVKDPANVQLRPGEILVAERTDPGWVMLFASAAAVLVERGSLLSHSAIVARELGIPSVVALPGLTAWLKDGDEVEIDGSSGTVTRIASEEAA